MSLLGQSKNCLTKCHKELPVMGGLEKTIRTGQAPAATPQHCPWVFSSSYLKDCWVVLVFNSCECSYLLGIYPLEPIGTFNIHNFLLQEVPSFTYKLHEELIPCVCFKFSYPIDLTSASSSIQIIQLFPFCYLLGSNNFVELSHVFISHFSLFQPWRVLLFVLSYNVTRSILLWVYTGAYYCPKSFFSFTVLWKKRRLPFLNEIPFH